VTYGLSHGDFEASAISYGTRTKFTLSRSGVPLGEIETTLLGAHNIENIAGVAALVLSRKLVSFEALAKAVADFQGIRRRLDNIAPKSRVPVFEGFGSSYEKARAALKAIKLHFPEKPIVVIFEPHTFGWRNRANLAWYDTAFTEATMVFVAPPETQGASTHDQLSHKDILEHVGTRARPYASPNDVIGGLTGNEVVLILTSGDLHGTLMSLAKEVEAKFS
jgi:UDP-N-acetylmuramate: L-alanyl-gamma-D-glutamyl-meso-diaminopimelate ligase